MNVTEYEVFVCSACEANELLAPADATSPKCRACEEPALDAKIMDDIRSLLGITQN